MPDPLAVRINDGATDRHVTKYVSNLSWTKVAPGGHQGLRFRLNLPRQVFDDLGPADKAWVYDAATGQALFGAAYLENPTPVDGASGQAFDISAVGGMALANDEARPLIYVDRDLSVFEKAIDSATAGDIQTGFWAPDPLHPENVSGFQRVANSFANGSLAATGAIASAGNYSFDGTGMFLGGIRVGNVSGGKTDSNWVAELVHGGGTIATGILTVGAGLLNLFVGDSTFPAGVSRFALRLRRTGPATNVADDLTLVDWVDYSIIGQRVNRYGTPLVGAAQLNSAIAVLASEVVEDLLGRLLTMCDPATAVIDTSNYGLTQLAYRDGVKAAGVLDDLTTYEPDFWWGIHESNDAGLHRFNYQRWSDEPRYVVSTQDGYRESGSDIDLCNRVLVSWTDAAGKSQTIPVTAADLGLVGMGLPVDALGSRVKDADPISLPDGHGSYDNAIQVGAAVLRDKINPPRAGAVTIRRPIVDMLTGNVVKPWELEPGWPVLVRERGDQMRCTEVDYDHDSRSAVLTLGTPVLSVDQRVARLSAA